jgi:hypothetical protein
MSRFHKIVSLVGEEKPGLICSALKRLFNLSEVISVLPVENDATSYLLQYEDKGVPYQICDSNGSSPDLIINYEEGPSDFIEITKGSFKGSGNNSQYQRFTKFIPVLNDDQRKIYYFDTEDKDLFGKTKLAMKCWKKNKIELVATNSTLQTVFNNLDNDFTLESFAKEWTNLSKPYRRGDPKQSIIIEEDLIRVENFNVLKKGKITHDPGIGTIMLVLSTILQFGSGKPILITGHRLSQDLINKSKRNKFLKFLCILKQKFQTDITIEGIQTPQCNIEYSCLSSGSTSEKCISIHDELSLINQGYPILYANHARSEQEYFRINGENISIPKLVYKPDIVYADKEKKVIYLVEAERYCNYETGMDQIESWRSDKTKNFYRGITDGTEYDGYQFRAYLSLYDSSDNCILCNQKYVKNILNSRRETYENENYETLDLF